MTFLCLEGGEGVGKTTQAKALYHHLLNKTKLNKVILSHEPGSTPFGEQIRTILKTSPDLTLKQQFHLFHAARIDHCLKVVKPAIKDDNVVICDRFYHSTYVYQNEIFSKEEWFEYFNKVDEELIGPDFVFLLDMDPTIAQKRLENRREIKDHWDNETIEQLSKKRNLFLDIPERQLFKGVFRIINADQEPEKITQKILETLEEYERI